MFTKDGMTVGVKELKDEDYRDRSQGLVFSFSLFSLGEKRKRIEAYNCLGFSGICGITLRSQRIRAGFGT